MTEYIDRVKLIADMEKRYCEPCIANKKDYNGVRCSACWAGDAIGEVRDAQVEDVAPVVHGRWIPSKHRSSFFMCSVCESNDKECQPFYINVWKYCPSCGAKMDLEDGE